ncbi:MAG: hypothetical protein ACKPKO_22740, partial [Candidatus Fonsibacter sp.]
ACPANEIVSRKMQKSCEMRQSIREMVKEAVKGEFPPRPPFKAMPKLPSKAASAAAVVECASGRECLQRSVGGREQKKLDEIFDWKLVQSPDGTYTPFWNLGPSTFAEYVQRAYWNSLSPSEETGYVDPGWLRRPANLDESMLVDSSGRKHLVGEIAAYVPNSQELRGISVCVATLACLWDV